MQSNHSRGTGDLVPDRRKQLSARRQEIIRPIFENPQDFVLLSVRASAEKLNTDSAFLLRVIQQLGFATFADFKQYLHELSLSNATSFERLQERAAVAPSVPGALHAALERSIENLKALQSSLDINRVVALARRLHSARRILILGGDMAAPVAEYLSYQLVMLGLAPMVLSNSGEMIYATRVVGKQDVVIAITFRRGLRSTVESLRDARKHGAYAVAITNTSNSGVARFCDDLFIVGIEGSSLRSSFVAPLAFTDTLVAACANVKRKAVLKLLSEAVDEQKHGYRWFNEE